MAFDLYAEADPALLGWLEENGNFLACADDQQLIQEGVNIDSIYILRSGHLSVYVSKDSNESNDILLATLQPGALVGEMSMIENKLPVASVVARAGSELLQVKREKLFVDLSKAADLECAFYRMLAFKISEQVKSQNQLALSSQFKVHVLIEPLRKVLTLFSDLNDRDIEWMRSNGISQQVSPGSLIIEQDKPVPDLLLIMAGSCEITINTPDGEVVVGYARRGEIIGEMSLLTKDRQLATANVKADSQGLQVLRLNKLQLMDQVQTNALFGAHMYKGLARMLSSRSRDQLKIFGLATRSQDDVVMDDDDDLLDFDELSGASKAGRLFDWLCKEMMG